MAGLPVETGKKGRQLQQQLLSSKGRSHHPIIHPSSNPRPPIQTAWPPPPAPGCRSQQPTSGFARLSAALGLILARSPCHSFTICRQADRHQQAEGQAMEQD
jgi:hypothetical protein